MIRYAGINSLIPTPEVEDYLRRYLPADWSRYFYAPASGTELGASDTIVPQFNWQRVFEPKINRLIWPTGASRWASILLLVTEAQLQYIKSQTELESEYSSHRPLPAQLVLCDSTFSTIPSDNGWSRDGKNIALSTRMYALDARPVSIPYEYKQNEETEEWSWVASQENTLWVLPLVDERWFWQWVNVDATQDTYAWTSTIQSVANGLGELDAIDTSPVSDNYDTPVDVIRPLFNVNAALATDAIANSVGHRVVRQIRDALQCVSPSDAVAMWNANFDDSRVDVYKYWQIIAGGDYTGLHYESATLPARVRVVFSGGGEETVELRDVGALQWGQTDSAATMFVSASPRNKRAFALQAASDYFTWRTKKADLTFAGIKAWIMTGFEDFVCWSLDPENGIQTRVVTHPTNLAMSASGDGNGSVYYALPQCDGEGIPAATDIDSPGKAYCCLFWLKISPAETNRLSPSRTILPVIKNGKIAREWVHNPYQNPAKDCDYLPVARMGNGALTLLSPPSTSDCNFPGQGGSSATSTTTTSRVRSTTTTSTAERCGRTMCRMVWDNTKKIWTKDSGCSPTTTTTSTTSTTTTGEGTSTSSSTTTGCACPLLTPEEGPWLTSTTTSSTTSSSTTTGDSTSSTSSTSSTTTTDACQCEMPTFCGSEEGQCTYTACSRLRVAPPKCGQTTTSTTTTSPSSTTTSCDCATSTTTPDPYTTTTTGDPATSTTQDPNGPYVPPCEGCSWKRVGYGGVVFTNLCGGDCVCPTWWASSVAPCSEMFFACMKPGGGGGPGPPPSCSGDCSWAGTQLLRSTCQGSAGCHCEPPVISNDPNCGNYITPCGITS